MASAKGLGTVLTLLGLALSIGCKYVLFPGHLLGPYHFLLVPRCLHVLPHLLQPQHTNEVVLKKHPRGFSLVLWAGKQGWGPYLLEARFSMLCGKTVSHP